MHNAVTIFIVSANNTNCMLYSKSTPDAISIMSYFITSIIEVLVYAYWKLRVGLSWWAVLLGDQLFFQKQQPLILGRHGPEGAQLLSVEGYFCCGQSLHLLLQCLSHWSGSRGCCHSPCLLVEAARRQWMRRRRCQERSTQWVGPKALQRQENR